MSVVIVVLILIILVSTVMYLYSRRKLYLFSVQLPGPPALPLVGNGLNFIGKNKKDILKIIMEITETYPSPMRLWLGPKLAIFITDPDQLQAVMNSSKMSVKSHIYSFLEPFMGKGLFTSNGIIHKNHRRLLQPLFNPKIIEGYSHLFQKHANRFVHSLEKYSNGDEFDILLELHDSAFEASMDILLEDKNDHTIDYGEIPKYIRRFYDMFFNRILSFWLHPDFIYKRTRFFQEQQYMVRLAKTMTQEIANTRIPEIEKRLQNKAVPDPNLESRTPSILEMMMEIVDETPNCLNEQEFIDHMLTFVATSQDTQSSAIAFTFMMLGLYPQIQDRVVEELLETLGTRSFLDFQDVAKLKYMEMCIKEAMRLFPLGPFLLRDTVEDFQLTDNWIIPKNCTVVLGVNNVHRNPKYWEKPDEFYPEHFTADAIAKRHPFAYLPFSAGPRRCVAQQFSYVNMKIVIGTLLKKYILKTKGTLQDIDLMTDVSIRPVKGYLVKIKPRC